MTRKAFFLYSLLLMSVAAISQSTVVLKEGSVRYEKKFNVFSRPPFNTENARRNYSQFRSTFFTLSFKEGYTYYRPDKANREINRVGEQPAENNIVDVDVMSKRFKESKEAFGKGYYVSDSLPKITWKITNERKTIAGFECKRANAIIMDSIYVVAFYSEAISPSGGPELFNGLPGMILGVVLPHEHISWFATEVYTKPIPLMPFPNVENNIFITNYQLKKTLLGNISYWGEQAYFYLMEIML